MKITKHKEGDVLTVGIEGVLNINTSVELRDQLKGEIEDVKEVIFDLQNTDYTSSAGLRVMLETHQILSQKGGKMILENVNKEFYEVLKISGFTDFIEIRR